MTLPTIEQVAEAFIKQLREDVTPKEFAELIAKQKEAPIEGVCYSHDYCDANMTMDAAFKSLGIDPLEHDYTEEDGMSQEVCDLWNSAWDRAKEMLVTL